MSNYIKYVSTAFLGFLIKITVIYILVPAVGLDYWLAYIVTTVGIIMLNYNILNRYIFFNKSNYEGKVFLFCILSFVSIFLGWGVASLLYKLTKSILISTAIAGAGTTSINYFFSKYKIWKIQ
ncbi:GtrA family protein [Microbulbifer thermotolerans]|uniref:GtrA family protein n=1 Tax=Microbulbifer thermotolerans TaxID=252514 RepID=UPI00396A2F0B